MSEAQTNALAALEQAAAARGVKLAHLSFLQLQIDTFEHEVIDVPSCEWPVAILQHVDRQLAAWRKRNKERVVVCSRSYSIERQCVVEIYHAHPSQLSKPEGSSVPAAAAPVMAAPASPRCVPCGE